MSDAMQRAPSVQSLTYARGVWREAAMGGAAQGQGQIPGHLVSRGRRSIRVAGERKFEAYGELAQALRQLHNGSARLGP